MSKKFTKTILSSAVAGLMLVSSGAMALDIPVKGSDYIVKFYKDGEGAKIVDAQGKEVLGAINTATGSVMSYNKKEMENAYTALIKKFKYNVDSPDFKKELQDIANKISFPVYSESLKLESLKKINKNDLDKVLALKDDISSKITSETAPAYVSAVRSGGNSDAALAAVKQGPGVLQEYNRIVTNIDRLNKDTTFAIDANGNITLDETGSVERESVKNVVAAIQADTTIYQEEDGSYTHDVTAPKNVRVSDAIVDLDKSIKDRTTVGVSSDGTLTRAEGAKNTISVNDGLVALSGRTDRIDAAVGAIDGRVTRNTQSIEKNSKAIAANTRTLQQHSARLDSQQRQINENHKEMKRAAAQSAALTGLFQPYSVGKFNATAAVGGYSDQQALAVGVGYRFNEQTAAKAGVAFSDGDASWNVGVNFEF
ncbi:YadA C-terminal domain-containing protein [Escherichia coli]|uniref:YadA C-terminal domain-containing protein n=5 Tax=Escherichia coli TaxID=562 RepID=UPI001583C55A|nr:YadA C-terminal domain-containing protein [Escherichia coli]NUJ25296.1 YadA-like family protein [Escherichia coli]QKP99820.1 YadA-like family protein [Escherichia coli]